MKIGLIHPPHEYKSDTKDLVHINGISYIEATLRESYDVKTVNFKHDSNASLEDIADCDIVGLTSLMDSYKFFKKALPEIKKQGKKIIVGGPLISSYGLTSSNLLMNLFPQIDFAVIGEGEKTIKGLIEKLENPSKQYPSGLVYRDSEGKLNTTNKAEIVHDLDELNEIDYHRWTGLAEELKGHGFSLLTSRGCPNHCSFCYKISPGTRSFSLARIEKEIQKVTELKPRRINFNDDTFTYDRKRAIGIAELVAKSGIKYSLLTRVDCLDTELLKILKDTGCEILRPGIESFDPYVLKKNGKNITLKQVYEAIEVAQKVGIKTIGFFLLGLPGETRESIRRTINGIKETRVFPRIRLVMPLPGTRIYHEALQKGLIDEIELLKQFSEPGHFDTGEGDWVPVNLTNLSDKELLDARNEIRELRAEFEKEYKENVNELR